MTHPDYKNPVEVQSTPSGRVVTPSYLPGKKGRSASQVPYYFQPAAPKAPAPAGIAKPPAAERPTPKFLGYTPDCELNGFFTNAACTAVSSLDPIGGSIMEASDGFAEGLWGPTSRMPLTAAQTTRAIWINTRITGTPLVRSFANASSNIKLQNAGKGLFIIGTAASLYSNYKSADGNLALATTKTAAQGVTVWGFTSAGAGWGAGIGTAIAPGPGTAIGTAAGGLAGAVVGTVASGKVGDWVEGTWNKLFG
ncbi:hypothetical protein GCM10023205_84970 [Yinghuangia aomiensis]|uniref:Uncharacterized protein n=1 Tax=Yinghuangia aomiensis TaxID=676205 RepID=A0ABP9IJ94_9ACTN